MKLQALPKAKMLLLAMAVIGLVSASFIPMAIAHDPTEKGLKDDGAHALSRTFPDVVPGTETWLCSTLLFPGKTPGEPCDQSNPSWVTGTWTGVDSAFYYDLQRTRMKVDECNDFNQTTDPTGTGEAKVGIAKCGTKITQATLLGVGSPNQFDVPADAVKWELNTCKSQHAVFQTSGVKLIGPPPDPALPAEATTINCHEDRNTTLLPKVWNTPVDVTEFLLPGPWKNSINTGFQRPTVEEVVTNQSKKPFDQPFYVASTLFIDVLTEHSPVFPKPPAKATHTEFRLGGDSCIDSHDWFLVLAGDPLGEGKPGAESWNEAVERHEVYDLSGSDLQGTAENQRPWGPGKTDEFSDPANPHDPKTSRPEGGCNDPKK